MKKSITALSLLVFFSVILTIFGSRPAHAQESCRFVIKGRLKVADVFTDRKRHTVNAFHEKVGVPELTGPVSLQQFNTVADTAAEVGAHVWQEPVLPRIKVKLSAKSLPGGIWSVWRTGTTDGNGNFTFTVDKNDTLTNKFCSKGIYVKISAQFDGKDFEIRQVSPDLNPLSNVIPLRWYTVLNSSLYEALLPGTWDFTAPFRAGRWTWYGDAFYFTLDPEMDNPAQLQFPPTRDSDLSEPEPYYHANIWFVLDKVAAYFRAFGAPYAFQKKFMVKTGDKQTLCNVFDVMDIAMASPVNGVLYLPTKDLVIDDDRPEDAASAVTVCPIHPHDKGSIGDYYAILHEIMHIWAYHHAAPFPGGGKLKLVEELIEQGSTHGYAKREQAAFHEGFAAFAGRHLLEMLVGEDLKKLYGSVDLLKLRYLSTDFSLMPRYPMNRYRFLQSNEGSYDVPIWVHYAYNRSLIDNFDDHWASHFNLMVTPRIQQYFLGTMTVGVRPGKPPYRDKMPDCVFPQGMINTEYCDQTVTVTNKKDMPCINNDYDDFACRSTESAYKFQTATGCEIPPWNLSFRDILTVFLANSTAGYPEPLGDADMTLNGFLTRASRVLPAKFSAAQKRAFWDLVDPVSNAQPKDALRCSLPSLAATPIAPSF